MFSSSAARLRGSCYSVVYNCVCYPDLIIYQLMLCSITRFYLLFGKPVHCMNFMICSRMLFRSCCSKEMVRPGCCSMAGTQEGLHLLHQKQPDYGNAVLSPLSQIQIISLNAEINKLFTSSVSNLQNVASEMS